MKNALSIRGYEEIIQMLDRAIRTAEDAQTKSESFDDKIHCASISKKISDARNILLKNLFVYGEYVDVFARKDRAQKELDNL